MVHTGLQVASWLGRHTKQMPERSTRPVASTVVVPPKTVRPPRDCKLNFLMARINQVELPADAPVYDSCPELVKKIKDFLNEDGVTKAAFCRALGDLNNNSLDPFLMGKKQDQCGTVAYPRAYRFFEKKRILEGKPKTARRLKNEAEHPNGFSLVKERPARYLYVVPRARFLF